MSDNWEKLPSLRLILRITIFVYMAHYDSKIREGIRWVNKTSIPIEIPHFVLQLIVHRRVSSSSYCFDSSFTVFTRWFWRSLTLWSHVPWRSQNRICTTRLSFKCLLNVHNSRWPEVTSRWNSVENANVKIENSQFGPTVRYVWYISVWQFYSLSICMMIKKV